MHNNALSHLWSTKLPQPAEVWIPQVFDRGPASDCTRCYRSCHAKPGFSYIIVFESELSFHAIPRDVQFWRCTFGTVGLLQFALYQSRLNQKPFPSLPEITARKTPQSPQQKLNSIFT